MSSPSYRRMPSAGTALGAIGALGIALSTFFMVGVDSLNHSAWAAGHVAAVGLSILVTVLGAVIEGRLAPLIGWISYGVMMSSAVLGLGLGAAVLRTRTLPDNPNFRYVLFISLAVFITALPVVLLVRRQERARARAI